MSTEEENIKLWKSVENTDQRYMKEVQYPFKHLSIDAQYQILTATRLWGEMGGKWGVKNEKFLPIPLPTDNVCSVIYSATFFHPNGEFSINSDIFIYTKANGGYKANNDYAKKVSTDALTKGLSKLGFSADIFMGKFDGSMYDSIENFDQVNSDNNNGEPETAKPETIKRLEDYLPLLAKDYPNKRLSLQKKISEGLTEEEALMLMDACARTTGVAK